MGASYIDDLNYSIMDFGGSGDALERDALFKNSSDGSTRTSFDEQKARNFMMLVAGDEDGYKSLTSAQQLYMASGLAAFETDEDRGVAFAQNAAKVHGILDESRSHGIREEFKDPEEAQQVLQEQNGEWRKSLVSGGVTVAATAGAAILLGPAAGVVAATAVPLVMESAGSVVTTAYGNHTLEYLKDHEYTNDPQALQAVQDVEKIGERAATQPVLNFAQNTGMSNKEATDLINEIEQSYLAGKTVISNNEKVSS
ncbi:hypothetical protein ABZ313_40345 [Streptomyces sp. NPDC006251]|uniref:hypothetical protein n=1 Tax=Streptomyces sp. NPDC006251 TaxID=3155718 RepID=UPI0033BEA8F5